MTQLVDRDGLEELDLKANQGEEIETGDNNGEQESERLILTDEEEVYTLGDSTESNHGVKIPEISFDLPCVIL